MTDKKVCEFYKNNGDKVCSCHSDSIIYVCSKELSYHCQYAINRRIKKGEGKTK